MANRGRPFKIAEKMEGPGGRVLPKKFHGEGYRKPDHAHHDLPVIARVARVELSSLGVFNGNEFVPDPLGAAVSA